ncbi:MAG: DedA family protein [Methylococcaceae bacterium]
MESSLHLGLHWLIATLSDWGYAGIFILMAMESSIFPIPSEIVMPPAGYLVQQGRMDLTLVILSGTFGSLAGAYANYYAAWYLGRPFLLRYGRYVGISGTRYTQVERYFLRHASISTFIGRLLPVVRHLISLPAGLARMNHWAFSVCTLAGAGLWVSVLTGIGFFIGENQQVLTRHAHEAVLAMLVLSGVIVAVYLWIRRRATIDDRDATV